MSSSRGVLVCGLVFSILAAALTPVRRAHAQSPGWAETFTAQSLSSHVQTGVTRVIVVAAGADRATAKEVTTAIEARLRSLSAALVMSDDALGAVSELDDAAIVSRAAPMPVDRVLVVRVFAGAAGAAPSAVAILYAKDGSVVTALNGTLGQPIAAAHVAVAPVAAPTATPTPAPSGVDSRAADTVSEITRNHQASREDAQRQYDEQYVAFDEMAAVTTGGNVVATWTVPYQGKYRKPLEGADFYLAVERTDLADKYRSRKGLKTGLLIGGISAFGLGTVLALYGITAESDECDTQSYSNPDECLIYKNDYTFLYIGSVIGIGGMVAWLASTAINPHPVEPTEARRIADEHNQRLRQRLGLSNETAALMIPEAPKARFSWDAFGTRGGAGLSLRLDY